jgi:putative ABC transport system permease protein
MKLYRWLLVLYPRDFRRRFGDGMQAAFAEDYTRARSRGLFTVLQFLMTTIFHALWFGVAERLPRLGTLRTFVSVDVRDAARALWATPVVTTVAVLSLALGIGANTALFSILNSLVLRPLPVREPERLAVIANSDWTNPIWEQIRARQHDLADSACAFSTERFDLADSGRTDPVDGGYVSGALFQTLGVDTMLGRPIVPADDVRGGGPEGHVAVVSYRFWRQRLGGTADVLGQRLTVGHVAFTIVGVTPPNFFGPEVGEAMDVFLPLAAEAAIRGRESALNGRSSWWLHMMIRLRPNQTLDAAAAAINAVRPAVRDATMPDWPADMKARYLTDAFRLVPASTGVSSLRARFEQPLTIIMIVVGAVLLIACANIANLMLARATARRHEMSIRLALGASRARLVCQMLVESLLLAMVGGAAGLALAKSGAALLIRQLGSDVTRVTLDLPIDWRVLAFTAAVALGATIVFGLAPALGLGSAAPNDALKDQGRSMTGDRRFGVRNMLVIAQVALSFVLVSGAALFVRTFTTLVNTPLGFEPSGLLIVSVDAARTGVPREQHVARAQQLAELIATVPGISRASLSFLTPLSGRGWTHRMQPIGGPVSSSPAFQTVFVNAVAPGWFETYGMRVRAGRDIAASDVTGSEPVGVVNEAFVRQFLGAKNPLGVRVKGIGFEQSERVIVGVVNDAVYRSARRGVVPTMYLAMAQANAFGSGFSVTARVQANRQTIERDLTEALSRADAKLAFSFRDYGDQIRETVVQERLVAMLSGFFGVLAMLLAGLGLYGVTSYAVGRQRAEIAVRLALGASPAGVVRMVLRRVLILLVSGAAIGMAMSLWAGKFVDALLFRVEARDPFTLAGAAAVLLAVGLFAGWLPARQASRLDPTAALRS